MAREADEEIGLILVMSGLYMCPCPPSSVSGVTVRDMQRAAAARLYYIAQKYRHSTSRLPPEVFPEYSREWVWAYTRRMVAQRGRLPPAGPVEEVGVHPGRSM